MLTIVLPDGTKRIGRGTVVVRAVGGMQEISGTMTGIDAADLVGMDGLTLVVEDGREAPLLVINHEVHAQGSGNTRWLANGPLAEP
jgi:hypothetical protein